MISNTKQFWNWWTEELRTWFTSKFSALTSVVAKDATVAKDSTVAKNATVAKEATLNSASSTISNKIGTATDTKTAATLFGKIADVKYDVEHLNTSDLAKRTDVKNGDNTTIGMLENQTYGLNALKNAISQGSGRIPADQYNALAKEDTLTTSTASIIAAMPSTSGLATEANATLNKETILAAIDNIDLSSIIGTDTTATLTALKGLIQELPQDADLTALQTALQGNDTTATLSALKTLIQAIPTTPISDYATETNATANKNTILAAIPTVPTDYAKQGNSASVTLTGVDTKVGDLDDIVDAINGDDISGILGYYTDEYADELESIIGTSNNE